MRLRSELHDRELSTGSFDRARLAISREIESERVSCGKII